MKLGVAELKENQKEKKMKGKCVSSIYSGRREREREKMDPNVPGRRRPDSVLNYVTLA